MIVPLFGFANAGVTLTGLGLDALRDPVTLGIAAGLFLGKQAGVFGSLRLLVGLGLAQRPAGATWGQVYGMAVLCGIGFTMSLFIGALAFTEGGQETAVKLGVLVGSGLSGLTGALIFWVASSRSVDRGAGAG